MDDITERILNCLLELGIVFEQEENNFELTDYIEDSLTFISFVITLLVGK